MNAFAHCRYYIVFLRFCQIFCMIFALFCPFMKVPAFVPAFFVEIFYKKVFDKNKKASIISGIKGKGVFGIIIPKGAFLFFRIS